MRTLRILLLLTSALALAATAGAQYYPVCGNGSPSLKPCPGLYNERVASGDPQALGEEVVSYAGSGVVAYGAGWAAGRVLHYSQNKATGVLGHRALYTVPSCPLVVGAVAVDTYAMPKYTPGGYTESSLFAFTDFNSPPRLQHYKSYVAPMPYTHPPMAQPTDTALAAPEPVGAEVRTGIYNLEY